MSTFLELSEPFGEFTFGDAQGHKRIDFGKALMAHAAKLLREQGEKENTYDRQNCFERAAALLEGLK